MTQETLRKLIDTFGRKTLIRAYSLNRFDGEPTAVSDYTQIPLNKVNLAIKAGEKLFEMAEEQRKFEKSLGYEWAGVLGRF